MDLRRMEFTWVGKSFTPERSRVFSWNTSWIVSKVVHTVLFSVFLQLIQSIFSVWTSSRFILGDHSWLISLVSSFVHGVLVVWYGLECVWILLSCEIIVHSWLSNWENLVGLDNISKQIGVGLSFFCFFSSSSIRMKFLSKLSVLFLDLFSCSCCLHSKNVIVIFL